MTHEQPVPETTTAIISYDGIFKGMYDDNLRQMFQDGRKQLACANFVAGKQTFERALDLATDLPMDRKILELILRELDRYEKCKINETTVADTVVWESVADRKLQRLDESLFSLPQSVFFLDIERPGKPGYVRLLGRKVISDLWIDFKIPELFCSFISAGMILGLFVDQRISDSNVTVFYHPLENSEKLRVMHDIVSRFGREVEVTFPFPLIRESTRREWGSPPEGWVVDDAFDVMLGCGEEIIRAYSIQFLQTVGLSRALLYDPACSTGVFLSTLQQAFPDSYTVGQDLSQQMANFAKERVNEVHCGNAMNPKIKLGTADVVYIRFLNSEVIKTCEAEELLNALLPTVKDGGYIIIFGHTPVLLSSSNYKCLKEFDYKQGVGIAPDKTGIFQYYVLQKKVK